MVFCLESFSEGRPYLLTLDRSHLAKFESYLLPTDILHISVLDSVVVTCLQLITDVSRQSFFLAHIGLSLKRHTRS